MQVVKAKEVGITAEPACRVVRLRDILLIEGDAHAYRPPLSPRPSTHPSRSALHPISDLAGTTRADQILGGVVPAAFVATKAITHVLLHLRFTESPLWAVVMREVTSDAALDGYTAFDRANAEAAGRLLLANGPVRVMDACIKAGLGQTVVHDAAEQASVL